MSVYSMTGFAIAMPPEGGDTDSTVGATAAVTVEMRSVNGRFLDIALRLPDELRGLEPALRELIGARVRRGKVEVRLVTRQGAENAWPQPVAEQLMALSRLENTVHTWLPKAAPLSVHEVLQWCRGASSAGVGDEVALAAAQRCADGLAEARRREGARLVAILKERTALLRRLAAQAAPLLPAVVQRQQQRFMERWAEALGAVGGGEAVSAEASRDRALNEAAAYAIRIDVAEELTRLGAHLDEIDRLLDKGGEVGKRLDFLIQELHREANTLGAKSAALELTAISVDMKVAIEQMREQVQNIE